MADEKVENFIAMYKRLHVASILSQFTILIKLSLPDIHLTPVLFLIRPYRDLFTITIQTKFNLSFKVSQWSGHTKSGK